MGCARIASRGRSTKRRKDRRQGAARPAEVGGLISSTAVGSEGSFRRGIRARRAGRRGVADRKPVDRSSHWIVPLLTTSPTSSKLSGEPNVV